MPPSCLSATLGIFLAFQGAGQTERVDENLTITWRKKTIEIQTKTVKLPSGEETTQEVPVLRFTEGVSAQYGVTEVRADRLEAHMDPDAPWGEAEGNVRLFDPEGMIEANKLHFEWRSGRGSAESVTAHVGEMRISAARVQIEPTSWTFFDVRAMPCDATNGFAISAETATMKPGQTVEFKRVRLRAFGRNVISLRRHQVSMASGRRGIGFPSISIRKDLKPSLVWSADHEFTSETLLGGSFGAGINRKVSGELFLTHSLLPVSSGALLANPHSELSEPFGNGYFDNISVRSPDQDREEFSTKRLSLSVGTALNRRVTTNTDFDRATKPWEVVLDSGSELMGFGIQAQLRHQRIGEDNRNFQTRSSALIGVAAPDWRLGKNLFTLVRADSRVYLNAGEDSGWARAQAGLIFRAKNFRIGTAYSVGSEWGTPAFSFDSAKPLESIHARFDGALGNFKLSMLNRFDVKNKNWFDREVALRWNMGCFEPYVLWREAPRRLTFGIELTSLRAFARLSSAFKNRDANNRPRPLAEGDPWN